MSSNKYKILVVQGLHEQGLQMLKNRTDIEFNVLMSDDENEILEAAKDVNGITAITAGRFICNLIGTAVRAGYFKK